MFDYLADLGVDGMMVSPGYSYAWAPDQEHFLKRDQTKALFREVLAPSAASAGGGGNSITRLSTSNFDGRVGLRLHAVGQSELQRARLQKPCYLLNDGYAESFKELLETTEWEKYGHHSGNPKCQDCMVHCGFEPTAVLDATRNLKNMLISIKGLS